MPLTTIFTPPAACRDIPFTYVTAKSGISTFWRDIYGPGKGINSICYPDSFRYQHRSTLSADYSPGVCPFGYTAASSAQNEARGAWQSWCCPSGMSYAQELGCYSTVTTSTTVMLNSMTSMTMLQPFVAADWYIQVAWASNQLDQFTPTSAPLLVQSGGYERPLEVPDLSDESRSALQVGIPVGVVTVAVIAVACYALWRRKRRRTRDEALGKDSDEDEKDLSPDDQNLRYDSAHAQTSSDGTTPTSTSNVTDTSEFSGDQRRAFSTARVESWPDSFDSTRPETTAR